MRHDLKPSPELSDRLSYEERDDQLVGTAHAFAQQNPGADVLVLTHDTGVMASAQMVRVAFVEIPDDWLLPPEANEAEKKIRALQAELTSLKRAEPQFCIRCLNADGEEIKKLEIDVVQYAPLTSDQVSTLMSEIRAGCPIATDFGKREPTERHANNTWFFGHEGDIYTCDRGRNRDLPGREISQVA